MAIMGWIYLLSSIVFEIGWASSLQYTSGYSRLWPSIVNALLAMGAIVALSKAVESIPIAIAYPVWTGLSLIGLVGLSLFVFDESLGIWHYLFIAFIFAGVIGLKAITNV